MFVLLGADWRDPEQLLHLQLALQIDRMPDREVVAVKWDPSSPVAGLNDS